jgi:peptidoglycan/xylan/chitin deacetylase (PgdA/CDA1 family)
MMILMNTCKTIAYHYVRPIKNSKYPEIKGLELDNFQNQLDHIQQNGQFTTIEQINDCIYGNKELPANSFLLTFDDGIKDIYQYVFPILKKRNIQGVFFTIAGPIKEFFVADVHKIHVILASEKDKQKIVEQIHAYIIANKDHFNLKTPQEYYSELRPHRYDSVEVNFIKQMLQNKLPSKLRKDLIKELFNKFVDQKESDFSKNLYISIEEIKEMVENGMVFGNHSYSHPWLTKLSLDEIKLEIQQSNNLLRKFQPNGIKTICYPYGDVNENVIQIAKNEGITIGFGGNVGDTNLVTQNPLHLSRFDTNDFPQN